MKLKPHKDHQGPNIDIDLTEIAMIEQSGQRTSKAGWVNVRIVLKSGTNTYIKMDPKDYDQLLVDWGR